MGSTNRATIGAACLALAVGVGTPWSVAWGQVKPPGGKSPLDRTEKTKLKPRSTPGGPKALGGLRPTGRREVPRQGQIQSSLRRVGRMVPGDTWVRDRVRRNTGGEMSIVLDGDTARVSEVFTVDGIPSRAKAKRNVLEAVRDGRRPESYEDIREMSRGDGPDLEGARREYAARGYDEVRVSEREVVFVKADDPGARHEVGYMLEGRVSEDMYRDWVNGWEREFPDREWIYDQSGTRRSCANGACSPGNTLDTFILRGGLEPERELTDVELAELEMDDLERAFYALERGDSTLAADRFESYVKGNPEEAAALRGLGITYLNMERFPEAVTAIAAAYELEPSLAGEPIDLVLFEDGAAGVYDLLQRVVPLAHRSKTSDASVVAVVLMQSQGRTKEASRMLRRAADKGLPESVQREFTFAGIEVYGKDAAGGK